MQNVDELKEQIRDKDEELSKFINQNSIKNEQIARLEADNTQLRNLLIDIKQNMQKSWEF